MLYAELDGNKGQWKIYGISVLIILGLYARDMMGMGINKYLFLMLALIPIFFAKIKDVAVFSCFLIPLYVGLPGNYVSAFLLVRLVYDAFKKRIPLNRTGFLLTLVITAYIILQNFFTGYTSIYHLMAAFDFIVLALIMSILRKYRAGEEAIVAYSVGNFALGAIMLGATLSYFSLQDLMNPATRLGYTGMLLNSSGADMATSIDPNFYAMNTIACISTVALAFPEFKSRRAKILALISAIGSTVCCMIGLSRTFIVLLAVWGVLLLISQGNIKKTFSVLVIAGILLFSFFRFMPTIAAGFLNRFQGADVVGGNGRITLILLYFEPWFETIHSMLFGIGLFNCHTHCAPLMYLFGLGIVGVLPLLAWFVYQWNQCRICSNMRHFKSIIPMFITLIAYSSIPAAGAINYTLPMLIPMLALIVSNGLEKPNE